MPTLAECLHDTIRFFNRYIFSLALLTLPLSIPTNLLIAWLTPADLTSLQLNDILLPALLSIATGAVSSAAVIYFIAGRIYQQPISLTRAYQAALAIYGSFFLLSLFESLAVWLGLSLLILPGLVLLTRFSYTGFELALRRQSVADAIKRSWQLTGSQQWLLFCGNTSVWFVLNRASFYLQQQAPDNIGLLLMVSSLESLFSTFCVIFAYRVYDAQLRQANV